jgi:hypothetical protein
MVAARTVSEKRQYLFAMVCVLLFVMAQTFQELAYRYWIPASNDPQSELLTYLLRANQLSAVLVMGSILLLMFPYAVIAHKFRNVAPMASLFGMMFGFAFIACEIAARSIDLFVVGQEWARQFEASSRETILLHFRLWNEIMRGWYFPLLLAHLLCSFAFLVATRRSKGLYVLAPLAFFLDGLRLIGRMLGMFAGQKWLEGLSGAAYFPTVLIINLMLALWFLRLAMGKEDADTNGSRIFTAP